jgi:hypothetical protein
MLCGNEKPQVRKQSSPDILIFVIHFTQSTGVSQLYFDPANSQTIGRFQGDLGGPDFAANNKLPD